jgi:prepilin-type N-terminal cleavage/methylation domain-containing protein
VAFPNYKKGFSLVEMLIALAFASLIITTAGFVYISGVKAWIKGENQIEVQQNLRIAMNTLYNEIRIADTIDIYSSGRKIKLHYSDINLSEKSYIFDPFSKEIKLQDSSSTVAMYIEDLRFQYYNNLILISVTTETKEGVASRNYFFRINARGKKVNVVN